jgi:hypothetical protein
VQHFKKNSCDRVFTVFLQLFVDFCSLFSDSEADFLRSGIRLERLPSASSVRGDNYESGVRSKE